MWERSARSVLTSAMFDAFSTKLARRLHFPCHSVGGWWLVVVPRVGSWQVEVGSLTSTRRRISKRRARGDPLHDEERKRRPDRDRDQENRHGGIGVADQQTGRGERDHESPVSGAHPALGAAPRPAQL